MDGKINLMRVAFHSQGLRPFIVNWEEFANHLLQRLHREILVERENEQSIALLSELMSSPGISEIFHPTNQTAHNALLLTLHLKKNDLELQFFLTIATLGTPYDITLEELRIECFFPASEATEHNWKQNENKL